MPSMELLLAALLGAALGSFLNVVIYRTPLERSVVRPGSACACCGTPLRPWQNVPILAYLLQRGRCAYCGTGFSPRYLALEVGMALATAGLAWRYGLAFKFWAVLALLAFCVTVFFTDLDHWIIPDEVNLFGALLGLEAARAWGVSWQSSLGGVAAGYLLFKSIQWVGLLMSGQEAMGEGDVKLACLIGAFLGVELGLQALGLGFVLGGIFALGRLLTGGKAKEPLPFGPFMAVAAVFVALL